MQRAPQNPGQWILPLFFLANAAVTAWLIGVLGVRAPMYHSFPWIFGAAFVLSLVPAARHRMTADPFIWRLVPVGVYALVITLASSVSPAASTKLSSNVFHPVEFAGLAFLAQIAAHGGAEPRPRWRRLLWVALACVAFGAADELHQRFVPGRDSAVADVGLDALGTVFGTLVYLVTHVLVRRLSQRR